MVWDTVQTRYFLHKFYQNKNLIIHISVTVTVTKYLGLGLWLYLLSGVMMYLSWNMMYVFENSCQFESGSSDCELKIDIYLYNVDIVESTPTNYIICYVQLMSTQY